MLDKHRILALLIAVQAMSGTALASSPQAPEERSLNELRNTVVNLLQTLVERGVMTREQAETLVRSAQEKAAADAAALAAQDAAEADAVRVPYVPEIVKAEIRKQVAAELAPAVAKDVIDQAKADGWGVPAALPEWVRRVRWGGDVRVRGQSDLFADDNFPSAFNFLAINDAGGITRAGLDALANTTEDRYRLRARVRMGLEAELGGGWGLAARLASGNLRDPVSTNQTLSNSGARYQTGLDLAYVRWSGVTSSGRNALSLIGGRIPNPWLSYDLVWDPDLTFEGAAATYRLGLTSNAAADHYAYLTLGAFPLQEVELSKDDKWLYGAQLGFDWRFDGGSRVRFGVSYHYYDNIVGRLNEFGSNLLDYTAPQYLQSGNTLFDIRNDQDDTTNLFALAADFHLVNATVGVDVMVTPAYRFSLTGEFVKNIGYDERAVASRLGFEVPARDKGYQAELGFGSAQMLRPGGWRVALGYRYIEPDAVLDAFTDSDFHLGGTNAKGYFITTDIAFSERVFGRLRYLSANEIDGQLYGVDILQLDVNAQF